jgi:hypothetical protein
MKVRVQVIIESDQGETQCVGDVAQFERGALQPETLGINTRQSQSPAPRRAADNGDRADHRLPERTVPMPNVWDTASV